jgi:GT2 family glycosyltransferase
VSDNGSCKETQEIYEALKEKHFNFSVIHNGKNLGIAGAVNQGWRQAVEGEIVCKIDNDCVINTPNWTEKVAFIFERMGEVGILGLKRKDLPEQPLAPNQAYRTKLHMVPHELGEPWMVVEEAKHVMGTCYCFSPLLRQRIGYLTQPGTVYGFDDAMAAYRCRHAGFMACFLHGVDIDHIDPGGNKVYDKWKRGEAAKGLTNFQEWCASVSYGKTEIYYDGGFADEA